LGRRPRHLTRRAAVYGVRFRIPADLTNGLGMKEFSRSLHAKDAQEARQRCLAATRWFGDTMARFRSSPPLSRTELESAAVEFFDRWAKDLDQPREFDLERHDEDVRFSIESSRDRLRQLDQQLAANVFDAQVSLRARNIVEEAGSDFDNLGAHDQLFAQAVRAGRTRVHASSAA